VRLSEQGFSGGTEGAPPSRVLCAKVGLLFYASLHIALSQRARVDDAVEAYQNAFKGLAEIRPEVAKRRRESTCSVEIEQQSATAGLAWKADPY